MRQWLAKLNHDCLVIRITHHADMIFLIDENVALVLRSRLSNQPSMQPAQRFQHAD